MLTLFCYYFNYFTKNNRYNSKIIVTRFADVKKKCRIYALPTLLMFPDVLLILNVTGGQSLPPLASLTGVGLGGCSSDSESDSEAPGPPASRTPT